MPPLLHCNRAFQRMMFIFGACCCLAVVPKSANAQDLSVTLNASVIVTLKDGGAQSRSAAQAGPGDLIEYRATYRNTSARRLEGVVATLPVPAGTMLHGADPNDAAAALEGKEAFDRSPGGGLPPWASQDGVHFAPTPLHQTVKKPDGTLYRQLLPRSAYRFLRWPLGAMPAGQSRTVAATVRVLAPDNPSLIPTSTASERR